MTTLAADETPESLLLSKCDLEPVFAIPMIQGDAVGLYLLLDVASGHTVLQTSANCEMFKALGRPEDVLGTKFEEFFTDKQQIRGLLLRLEKKDIWHGCELKVNPIEISTDDWWEGTFDESDMAIYLDRCAKISPSMERRVSLGVSLRGGDEHAEILAVRLMHGARECVLIEMFPRTRNSFFMQEAEMQELHDQALDLSEAQDFDRLVARATQIIHGICRSDRAMLFKFAEDGSGWIVAEENGPELDLKKHGSFLGLRFPAADISKQARALFKRNRIRYKRAVGSNAVALTPRFIDGKAVDLSDSLLRAVSPVQVRFLRNMGVKGTVTLAIVIDDAIWGMFVCHHYEGPLNLTYKDISHLLVAVAIFSSALSMMKAKLQLHASKGTETIRGRLRTEMETKIEDILREESKKLCTVSGSPSVVIFQYKALMEDVDDLLRNDSRRASSSLQEREDFTSLTVDGRRVQSVLRLGSKVPLEPLAQVVTELFRSNEANVVRSDSVFRDCPGSRSTLKEHWAAADLICGVVACRCITCDIAFVRPEALQTVSWAGKEAIDLDAKKLTGTRLEPRASFHAYIQEKRRSAVELSEIEFETICVIREALALRAQQSLERERMSTSKLVKKFLGSMSHELRTPFNGIVGMLSVLLQEENLSDNSREMLQTINRSTEAMLNILDGILTATKLDQGRLAITDEVFQVSELIDDVAKLFQVRCQSSGITLRYEIEVTDPSLPQELASVYFMADQGRIRQILVNILGNAIKFVREETGTATLRCTVCRNLDEVESKVFITSRFHASASHDCHTITENLRKGEAAFSETHPQDAALRWLLFAVEDNGIGIDALGMTKLFQKFEQLDSGAKKMYQGTGLGLAICSDLCKLMNGMIWCHSSGADAPEELISRIESRSSFQFAIPVLLTDAADIAVSEVDDAHHHSVESIPISPNMEAKSVRRRSVFNEDEVVLLREAEKAFKPICLAADDNKINRIVLGTLFKKACPHLHLLCLHNGDSAIAAFQSLGEKVAVVALDLYMPPGPSGLQVAGAIAGVSSQVPIFIMTAETDDGDLRNDCRISGVIAKPLTIEVVGEIFKSRQ